MRGCERLLNNDRIDYRKRRISTVRALGDSVQIELRLLQERVQIGDRSKRKLPWKQMCL